MINFNTLKSLNIILPNTNKALNEVMKSITPKELETLSKGKDLKSILNTLLQGSGSDDKADKKLLTLLKQAPTFKELGSVSKTIQELLQTLQKEKFPLPLEKQLTNFLDNIKNISEKSLKTKIENSGIYLENKIKNIQTPQVKFRRTLQELSNVLQNTKLPNVKALNTQLKELLSSDLFKNISNSDILKDVKPDMKVILQMNKDVSSLLDKIGERLNSAVDKTLQPNDALFSRESKTLLSKLHLLNKPELLQTQNAAKELFSQDVKSLLLKAETEVQNSDSPNKTQLLKQIDKLSLQIDYHQLLSQLSSASSLYIPYSWEMLEDGNITIKSAKDDKFFTDIELTLKDYGELKLRLGLFEGNQLNINISAQSKNLKKILQENMSTLKQQLFSVGITPSSIRFLDEDSTLSSAYNQNNQNLNTGFEAKA